MLRAVLGVDIGTSSSKGVLVTLDGRVVASAVREHRVDRPRPGWVEMDSEVWSQELESLTAQLLATTPVDVLAVGVSGMGPCVLLADSDGHPLRPAILYGVDSRATAQIDRLNARYGAEQIRARCGSGLSSQAAGAKIAWVGDVEPELFHRARRIFMPSSWLVYQLTGQYVLDHQSASQCTPLYDVDAYEWYEPWVGDICPDLELPPLNWPGDIAGVVTRDAADRTGLPVGVPVITGTVDAWAEALSVNAHSVGDLMLMYGTTMFLVNTVQEKLTSPYLWGTVGARPYTHNLAGGMATSGAITAWLRDLFGSDFAALSRLAAASPPGADGLLMLPYFAGERTPVMDPQARGVLVGLSLSHTRGDLYRAALEATGLGVRHNIDAIEEAGGDVRRIVAVGGGAQGQLWSQIVCDITQRPQSIPTHTIGACFGGALLAAESVSAVSIAAWNPIRAVREPRPELAGLYDHLFAAYLDLYSSTRSLAHELAARQGAWMPNAAPEKDTEPSR